MSFPFTIRFRRLISIMKYTDIFDITLSSLVGKLLDGPWGLNGRQTTINSRMLLLVSHKSGMCGVRTNIMLGKIRINRDKSWPRRGNAASSARNASCQHVRGISQFGPISVVCYLCGGIARYPPPLRVMSPPQPCHHSVSYTTTLLITSRGHEKMPTTLIGETESRNHFAVCQNRSTMISPIRSVRQTN